MSGDNGPADVSGDPDAGGWTGGITVAPRGERDRCRSCLKPIRWITMGSGSPMPVEAKSQLVIVERANPRQGGLFGEEAGPAIAGHVTRGWIPHWASCPDAGVWRRNQAAAAPSLGGLDGDTKKPGEH